MPAFTPAELDVLSALASPLSPHARYRFLRLVASKLSGYPPEVRGPGLVHRLARLGNPEGSSWANPQGLRK